MDALSSSLLSYNLVLKGTVGIINDRSVYDPWQWLAHYVLRRGRKRHELTVAEDRGWKVKTIALESLTLRLVDGHKEGWDNGADRPRQADWRSGCG